MRAREGRRAGRGCRRASTRVLARTEELETRDARVDVGDRARRDRADADDGERGAGTGDRGERDSAGGDGERGGGSTARRPELFAGGNIGPGANRWWIGAEVQLPLDRTTDL